MGLGGGGVRHDYIPPMFDCLLATVYAFAVENYSENSKLANNSASF